MKLLRRGGSRKLPGNDRTETFWCNRAGINQQGARVVTAESNDRATSTGNWPDGRGTLGIGPLKTGFTEIVRDFGSNVAYPHGSAKACDCRSVTATRRLIAPWPAFAGPSRAVDPANGRVLRQLVANRLWSLETQAVPVHLRPRIFQSSLGRDQSGVCNFGRI